MENEVKKMNSQLLNSHFCEENSEWLAENVKGIDQSIEEMLSIIEQDGDKPMEKSELISHIKEISHKHHLLAENYSKLTGEFRNYIQSATEMHDNKGNSFGSPQNPFLQTPDKKLLGMQNVDSQVNSSEISLSSGGGISDNSFNEDSGSSSSLSSDSDAESCYSTPYQIPSSVSSGKMQKFKIATQEIAVKIEDYEILLGQVSKYEEELKVSNQKLVLAEEEIAKLKSQLEQNEVDLIKMGGLEDQLVSAKNKIELQEADIEMENRKSLSLQGQIVELEAKFTSEKSQVSELQESVKKYAAQLSDRELQIEKLRAELEVASGNFALDKWQLESCISKLSERLTFQEATTEELRVESESLADQIKKLDALKLEMEREQNTLKLSWQADNENLRAEINQKNELVASLNKNLDGLKLKYDMLVAEKDGVDAKLQALIAELSARDDKIQLLEYNVSDLHSRNEWLCAESESANKLTADLKLKNDELEKELGRQRTVVLEGAEEKREAIRQLSFSIDHFRSAYEELRDAYVIRKRAMAVVS